MVAAKEEKRVCGSEVCVSARLFRSGRGRGRLRRSGFVGLRRVCARLFRSGRGVLIAIRYCYAYAVWKGMLLLYTSRLFVVCDGSVVSIAQCFLLSLFFFLLFLFD